MNLKNVGNILYDHWLVVVSLFGLGIFKLLASLIPKIFNLPIPLWICLTSIFSAIFITIYFKKPKGKLIILSSSRPSNKFGDYGSHKMFKVNWRVWLGYDGSVSDRRIWADGPFCPDCNYELDQYSDRWFCVPCEKKFKKMKHIREFTRERVIKIFEAEAQKTGSKFNFSS